MNLKIGNENEKKRKEKLNIRKPAKQNLEKRRGAAFFFNVTFGEQQEVKVVEVGILSEQS